MAKPVRTFFVAAVIFLILLSCSSGVESEVLSSDYYNLGLSFHELDQYEKAEFYYKKALSQDRGAWDARFNLALLYIDSNQPDKARPHLMDLYKRDENNTTIMNSLGVVYSLKEEYEEALTWYNRVLEVFPWDKRALYNSHLIYLKLEQPEESLANLEKLWERYKSYSTAKALIEEREELTSAQEILLLEEVEEVEEGSEESEMTKRLITLYVEEERTEEALFLIDSTLEDEEERGWLLFQRGEILIDLFRTEEGFASIQDAFREGYRDKGTLDSLADRLSPTAKRTLQRLEELYFPSSED